jgi:hypothetical protein
MDHLPYPEGSILPTIEIPFLCFNNQSYDGLGLERYPARRGWVTSSSPPQLREWANCPAHIAAERAQTWLYFGLIIQLTGINTTTDWHKAGSGQYPLVLDSSRMLEVLKPLRDRSVLLGNNSRHDLNYIWNLTHARHSTFEDLSKSGNDIDGQIHAMLLEVDFQSDALSTSSEPSRSISLSIKILVDEIRFALLGRAKVEVSVDPLLGSDNTFYPYSEWEDIERRKVKGQQSPFSKPYSYPGIHNSLLRERMDGRAWCPVLVSQILTNYTYAASYFLSFLPRLPRLDEDHSKCTLSICRTNNIQPDDYVSAHCHTCKGCLFVESCEEDIVKIIKKGGTPLINVRELPSGGIKLDIIEAVHSTQYFAVSHVWSGGLGNFTANAMPSCQIWRLKKLGHSVRKASSSSQHQIFQQSHSSENIPLPDASAKPMPFWIDTLCIPVHPLHVATRLAAINRMAQIYARATCVLILDQELQQMSCMQDNSTIFGHIRCCSWMSRCWTFQEGAMARHWFIDCIDGVYDVASGFTDLISSNSSTDNHSHLRKELFQWYVDMPNLSLSKKLLELNFVSVWNSLCERSTTMTEDLPGILAILIGLKPSEILSLPVEDRMKAIFNSQKRLPTSFLFRLPQTPLANPSRYWLPNSISKPFLKSEHGAMLKVVTVIRGQPESRYQLYPVHDWNEREWYESARIAAIYTVDSIDLLSARIQLRSIDQQLSILINAYLTRGQDTPISGRVCILISDMKALKTHKRHTVVPGACFLIKYEDEDVLDMTYICPIECTASNHDGTECKALAQEMLINHKIYVDCGMF